jgi:hypothetical protein
VTDLQRDVFFVAFICALASSVLVIAPSAYHRLRWREGDNLVLVRPAAGPPIVVSARFARRGSRG